MIELHLSKNPRDRKVVIDGQDVTRYVIAVSVTASSQELPVVELELLGDVRVASDGKIIYELPHDLPDVTKAEHA